MYRVWLALRWTVSDGRWGYWLGGAAVYAAVVLAGGLWR